MTHCPDSRRIFRPSGGICRVTYTRCKVDIFLCTFPVRVIFKGATAIRWSPRSAIRLHHIARREWICGQVSERWEWYFGVLLCACAWLWLSFRGRFLCVPLANMIRGRVSGIQIFVWLQDWSEILGDFKPKLNLKYRHTSNFYSFSLTHTLTQSQKQIAQMFQSQQWTCFP